MTIYYFFCSIDLVGSTQFKNELHLWAGCFYNFYQAATKQFSEAEAHLGNVSYCNLNIFKLLGDEVLLYREIVSKSEIYKCLNTVKVLSSDIRNEVRSSTKIPIIAEIFEYERTDKNKLLSIKLDIKTTCWLSIGKEIANGKLMNVREYDLLLTRINDIIGPQMDMGFRLSEHAKQGKVLLSPDLALIALTCKNTQYSFSLEYNKNCKLRGISKNGKRYPIVYLTDGKCKDVKPKIEKRIGKIYTDQQRVIKDLWCNLA